MKDFRSVERTRHAYHRDPTRNSVHRSSLIVPELPGCAAEITFLNHFLLKRGYPNVACRITAVDATGALIESRLHAVRDPRVYVLPLREMFTAAPASYLVEFFAAENLVVPFPAVMVNHKGPHFFNAVHAYNRALNDVFESDDINAHPRPEASIDVRVEQDVDTFAVFTAGPLGGRQDLRLQLITGDGTLECALPLEVPRFCHYTVPLTSAFPGLGPGTQGIFKIYPAPQALFYGRMLVGTRTRDGAFSANHSYYDCSTFEEYWDDTEESYRLYPFFEGFHNVVRMYPIMSPSSLAVSVAVHGRDGTELGRWPVGEVTSPGSRFLEIDVGELAVARQIDLHDVGSFAVWAKAATRAMPMRTNHQLVHGRGGLNSSINVSLVNPNVFVPPGARGLTWTQVSVGDAVDSRVGLVGNAPHGPATEVAIDMYSREGHLGTMRRILAPGAAIHLDVARDLALPEGRTEALGYVWLLARADRADLSFFGVTRHRQSGHCTGEHGF